jgi:hypothetical protein
MKNIVLVRGYRRYFAGCWFFARRSHGKKGMFTISSIINGAMGIEIYRIDLRIIP